MGRRKQNEASGELTLMAGTPERDGSMPSVPETVPAIFEYTPLTASDKWRVEKFELFLAEFELGKPWEKTVPLFHELAASYSRGWLFARRLFGIAPLIPSVDSLPDDLHVFTREQICAGFGIAKEDLKAELDALRGIWKSAGEKQIAPEQEPGRLEAGRPPEGLPFPDEVLREFGFSEAMFKVMIYDAARKTEVPRLEEENRIEREWFIKQVNDWRKMLSQPMAGTLARQALMNNLYLRRLETEMAVITPGSDKFSKLQKTKNEIEATYQIQLTELQNMFPEMAIAGNVSFRAVISDLVKSVQEYQGKRSTQLIDRIRTAAEIDVELRQSQQAPEVRYRFGLNIYLVEAIHGLYDPNWRSQLRPMALKKLDTGFRRAVEEVRQAQGESLIDLEKGVLPEEGDQYPDLVEVEG